MMAGKVKPEKPILKRKNKEEGNDYEINISDFLQKTYERLLRNIGRGQERH